jgi:hypothetical protein
MRILSLAFISTIILVGLSFRSVTKDKIESSNYFMPDTTILPKIDSNYAVKLLIPGKFKLDDIKFDATTMPWFALMKNGSFFSIQKHIPEQTKIIDSDKSEKWEIKEHDSLKTILMVSGVEMLEKEVIEMKLGNKTFNVGDRLELNYNGKKFVVTADGDEQKDKSTKKKYIANYRLYIAPLKKEKNRTLLVYHKRVDDVFPNIIFMGDLDNDKKPDLIMNNTVSANENHLTLFMTNNSPKGKMFKVMGVFNYSK